MIIKLWISAFRFRTLPLALSGIITGYIVADDLAIAHLDIFSAAAMTAIFLQILSNLSNDYGDFVKGTDNEKRIGNMRALQSGKISPKSMLSMIFLFIALSLSSGIYLLHISLNDSFSLSFILFFLLGIFSILAAIYYTIGKRAYGYSGLGDISVFVFFGPVAVLGSFLLHSQVQFHFEKNIIALLPAISIGLLSVGVLNTNNIRDIENDAISGKMTLPVKNGLLWAKNYHLVIVVVALFAMWSYALISYGVYAVLVIIASFPIIKQMLQVRKLDPSPAYNALLKKLSMGTLMLVLSLVAIKVLTVINLITPLLEKP
jgi:1,4-dihydroxy-2-naphthoate octaprenyltransferase